MFCDSVDSIIRDYDDAFARLLACKELGVSEGSLTYRMAYQNYLHVKSRYEEAMRDADYGRSQ